MITNSTIVVAKPEQVSSDLVNESVILDLKSGMYYGLNEVGSIIWKFIQSPQSVNSVVNEVINNYDVEINQCNNDVLQLLHNLLDAKLISICDEKNL
ncbi:PqqD family peptide modification chaperone [Synechococcales cyanobacterium C]|uniref:PqqD family peptide modification chaperone n=1 Tax=Petrachloros mirabilis ULC683 TaxID=2781853 RepID=A0A8K1ZZE7_9CYAN|nr:PqqD family peptide modification chaperone [Petrachloros mirabilis]NCJ08145.1 PqqD family peptide modification chaperone [Petrachloros mirabilis ULC683]